MDNQKKNTGVYILIAVLCVLILVLVGYIVYDKTQNNKTVTTDTTNKASNSNTNNLVSKLDDTKDWVYDAEYKKNVTSDSYSTCCETYYAKDIVVPYINVNSSYVNTVNSDIKKVFDDAIKNYNDGVSNKITYVDECGYKKYITDNSLSVVLTYGVGATDVVHPNYYTYNINLKTGNQLSYEDVYKIAGLNSSNIDSKVENAITKIMKEEMSEISSDDYPSGTTFDTYNNQSISNYKESVSNNTLKYFLSENGKLNIVVTLSTPFGSGEFDTIVKVD